MTSVPYRFYFNIFLKCVCHQNLGFSIIAEGFKAHLYTKIVHVNLLNLFQQVTLPTTQVFKVKN